MKYSKLDAKDHARENMRGIWAAALNPFRGDFSFDEQGLRANIRPGQQLFEYGISD